MPPSFQPPIESFISSARSVHTNENNYKTNSIEGGAVSKSKSTSFYYASLSNRKTSFKNNNYKKYEKVLRNDNNNSNDNNNNDNDNSVVAASHSMDNTNNNIKSNKNMNEKSELDDIDAITSIYVNSGDKDESQTNNYNDESLNNKYNNDNGIQNENNVGENKKKLSFIDDLEFQHQLTVEKEENEKNKNFENEEIAVQDLLDIESTLVFHTEFYLTSKNNNNSASTTTSTTTATHNKTTDENKNELYNSNPNVKLGVRLDVKELFARVEKLCKKEKLNRVAVLTCGPQLLVNDVFDLCRKSQLQSCLNFNSDNDIDDHVVFDCHKEIFTL